MVMVEAIIEPIADGYVDCVGCGVVSTAAAAVRIGIDGRRGRQVSIPRAGEK